jgi:hypothetical protein
MAGMAHDNPVLEVAISLIPLGLAIYGTVTGTAVIKSSKIERAKNPIQYWLLLGLNTVSLYGWLQWQFQNDALSRV